MTTAPAAPGVVQNSVVQISVVQISDAALSLDELVARIARAAHPPRFAVQLRDPGLPGRELAARGAVLREHTRRVGARLIVNDRLDIAIALDADGLHLGRRSIGIGDVRARWRGLVTAAAHGVDEAVALGAEADAVLLSPIFPSPGKGAPLGLEALSSARERMARSCALIALGGIDAATAMRCFEAGADGIASIRADLTRFS